MKPAEKITLWGDKLRDISAMGLHFSEDPYDRENYRNIQDIAMEMIALASGDDLENMEKLRATIFSRPTPLSVGDAAVIDDGRILLIRRADNGLWAMPGGALEVGETPAEGCAREAFEETGIQCNPVSLVGVFDSRLCGTPSRHHLYHFTILCEPINLDNVQEPTHPQEVLDKGWFKESELPEDMDPGHVSRIPFAFRAWRGVVNAFIDKKISE